MKGLIIVDEYALKLERIRKEGRTDVVSTIPTADAVLTYVERLAFTKVTYENVPPILLNPVTVLTALFNRYVFALICSDIYVPRGSKGLKI